MIFEKRLVASTTAAVDVQEVSRAMPAKRWSYSQEDEASKRLSQAEQGEAVESAADLAMVKLEVEEHTMKADAAEGTKSQKAGAAVWLPVMEEASTEGLRGLRVALQAESAKATGQSLNQWH